MELVTVSEFVQDGLRHHAPPVTEYGSHSNGATNVMPLVVADVAGIRLLPICS